MNDALGNAVGVVLEIILVHVYYRIRMAKTGDEEPDVETVDKVRQILTQEEIPRKFPRYIAHLGPQ